MKRLKRILFAAAFVLPFGLLKATPGDDFPLLDTLAARAADRLDLTDAQQAQLKDAVRLHLPTLKPLAETLRAEHQKFAELSRQAPADQAALSAQADRMLTAQKALMLAGASLREDLRAVLTPEQLDKLDAFRAANSGRFEKFSQKFEAWLQ